ncbi:MAG: 6-phosphogluconolactonase [Gemmatimonadota bacterium]|nr:MAG: 6-phosphogluconolactonase [Gemmatimonadota bacterium]
MKNVKIFPDLDSLAHAVAEQFLKLAVKAIATHGRCALSLAGGSTPRKIYSLLASEEFVKKIGWQFVHVFWGDERCVPPDHSDSNYRMARETLLDHVPLPKDNIHRIRGEIEPAKAADDYERRLLSFFYPRFRRKEIRTGELLPRFDLVLLGIGQDGHTASLFPDNSALDEKERLVTSVYAPPEITPRWRITMTLPVLNNASSVFFIVTGAHKRETVQAILNDSKTSRKRYPAAMVRPKRGAVWWLDGDVAGSSGRERTKKRRL